MCFDITTVSFILLMLVSNILQDTPFFVENLIRIVSWIYLDSNRQLKIKIFFCGFSFSMLDSIFATFHYHSKQYHQSPTSLLLELGAVNVAQIDTENFEIKPSNLDNVNITKSIPLNCKSPSFRINNYFTIVIMKII